MGGKLRGSWGEVEGNLRGSWGEVERKVEGKLGGNRGKIENGPVEKLFRKHQKEKTFN